jgi:hypothetical protein
VILDRSGLRKLLSVKAAKEIDEALARGDVPAITCETVKATLAGHSAKAKDYLRDAVVEVHNWLRPRSEYKTNSEFDIGRKVILGWAVTTGWKTGSFRVNYHRDANFRALDNVFALLAGNPQPTSHNGPLADAICASPSGTGETEFFRFRCFKNGNLHLEFKRMDLIEKLNAIAGGNALYSGD